MVRNYYSFTPFLTRFFLTLRHGYTPYSEMSQLLPKAGKILDLGCGHGLLSLTLALESSLREVKGLDHDPKRIEQARQASQKTSNLLFEICDLSSLELPQKTYAGISLIDVLHYFPCAVQEKILKTALQAVTPGGVLLFREVDLHAGLLTKLNKIHEKIMTSFGLTKSGASLYFRDEKEWLALIESSHFSVRILKQHRFPFADCLYICTEKGAK